MLTFAPWPGFDPERGRKRERTTLWLSATSVSCRSWIDRRRDISRRCVAACMRRFALRVRAVASSCDIRSSRSEIFLRSSALSSSSVAYLRSSVRCTPTSCSSFRATLLCRARSFAPNGDSRRADSETRRVSFARSSFKLAFCGGEGRKEGRRRKGVRRGNTNTHTHTQQSAPARHTTHTRHAPQLGEVPHCAPRAAAM